MSDKKQTILVLIIVIVLFAAIGTGVLLVAHFDKIPSNPDGTIGNTAGNLNNEGLFCESDGVVYFSNIFDGGALYSMNVDETNIKKITNNVTRNILAGGDYLYYFQSGTAQKGGFGYLKAPSAFSRCRKDGKKMQSITRSIIVTGQLVGDYLYLLDNNDSNPCLRKVKIDKSEETVLAEYVINPACAVGNTIYYNGTVSNHNLYTLNTVSNVSSRLWEYNVWYPVVDGNYVYFMDIENGYRLCRYSISTNTMEVLADDRVECFNVGNGYIYYQTGGNDPKLMWMYTDGSSKTVLAQGVYTKINMTSMYVYVQSFFDSTTTYHSPLGSTNLEVFSNAYILSLPE